MNACTRPNHSPPLRSARHAASGQHGVAGVKHHPRVLNSKMNWTDKPHPPAKPATALQRQVSGVQGAAPSWSQCMATVQTWQRGPPPTRNHSCQKCHKGRRAWGLPAQRACSGLHGPRPDQAEPPRAMAQPCRAQEDVGPSKAEQTCGCMHPGAQPRPPGRAAQLRGQWRQRGSLRARRRPRRATASARAARRRRAAGPSRQRALQSPARCARAARRRRAAGRRAAAAGAHAAWRRRPRAARRGRPPLLRRGAALAATS